MTLDLGEKSIYGWKTAEAEPTQETRGRRPILQLFPGIVQASKQLKRILSVYRQYSSGVTGTSGSKIRSKYIYLKQDTAIYTHYI